MNLSKLYLSFSSLWGKIIFKAIHWGKQYNFHFFFIYNCNTDAVRTKVPKLNTVWEHWSFMDLLWMCQWHKAYNDDTSSILIPLCAVVAKRNDYAWPDFSNNSHSSFDDICKTYSIVCIQYVATYLYLNTVPSYVLTIRLWVSLKIVYWTDLTFHQRCWLELRRWS